MGTGERGTTIERALAPAEVEAANDVTRRWFASRPHPPAAVSGLGLWPLLTTLAAGASGRTAAELLDAAGVGPERAESITGGLLGAAASAPALHLAVGVWAGASITLDPAWVAKLPSGAVGTLTGEPAADKAALDRWASEETDGMIERMPLDCTRRIDLALASALAVRTTWVTAFRDAAIPFRSGPWAGLGPCRVLSNTIRGDVLRVSDEAAVLTVPGHDDIDVLLALGRADLAPGKVFAALVDAAADPDWGRSSEDLRPGERAPGVTVAEHRAPRPQTAPEVDVRTVRFAVEADLDLSEDAAALGLVRASDEAHAEFDRLAAEPTHVSQARQSCVAVFSATGFKAAAVTAMAMTRTAGVPQMRHTHRRASIVFDRPFAYAARHRPSGLILVGGWVDEPEWAA